MCRRNKGQSKRRRLICSRRRACSEEFRLTMIGEGTAVSGATLGWFALSGVAKEVCRCPYQFLPSVRPMPWFDLERSRWRGGRLRRDRFWKRVLIDKFAHRERSSL